MKKKLIVGGALVGLGIAGYCAYNLYKKSKETSSSISELIKNAKTVTMDELEKMCASGDEEEEPEDTKIEREDFFAKAQEAAP